MANSKEVYKGILGIPFRLDNFSDGIIKLLSYKKTIGGVSFLALAYYLYSKRTGRSRSSAKPGSNASTSSSTAKGKSASGRGRFLAQMRHILRTGMPSPWCREYLDAFLLAAALLGRTWLSLVIARFFGQSVKQLASQDYGALRANIPNYFAITIPAALLNASLHYLRSVLALDMREKITLKVHELYMEKMNYYKANKVGQKKLENADQLIAEDIEKWTDTLAEVFSEVLKPTVDIFVFTHALYKLQGLQGPTVLYVWFLIASVISGLVLPSFGRMAVKRQEVEGQYRAMQARLIENSEMIAFMGGEVPEKRLIDRFFNAIKSYVRWVNGRLLLSNSVVGYVNKYAASSVGFALVVLPVLWPTGTMHTASAAEISGYYVESSRHMINLAEAILALFEVQKLIGHLSGLTARVDNLITTLEKPEELDLPKDPENPPIILEGDHLAFKHVSLFKPDGTPLLRDVTFEVPAGTRVIITGENGVGKSSLFRVLRGLWPLSQGTIITPPRESTKTFYFLSQANFVPVGSLREIVIYPHQLEDMRREGKTDEDIMQALEWSHLRKLKVNGVMPSLDTVLDWQVDLSPGQKQRMAFARLFYHRPKYAVLDDCTNGVASDIELDLYRRLKDLNITVISISHKRELKKLHDYELHYNADGTYEWIKLDAQS